MVAMHGLILKRPMRKGKGGEERQRTYCLAEINVLTWWIAHRSISRLDLRSTRVPNHPRLPPPRSFPF